MKTYKVQSYEELSEMAAQLIKRKVAEKPDAVLGLATGSTPTGMYERLVNEYKQGDLSFEKVKTFNLDEYVGINRSHPQSYYQFMQHHLFKSIDVKEENIYIPNGFADNPLRECERYDQKLKESGPVDLQVLGLGVNGHIGFNEPGTSFQSRTHVIKLTDSTREANARFFKSKEDVPTHAITMGIENIMESREILLLAYGENKKPAIKRLLEGEVSEEFPASILTQHPNVRVIYGW
ncbi:glucosamine-6-phosphate deaminase [Piscibacillus sp. B03]|uniref:glucosamine-6-phosphate deaminase n=1 Tax=Piscibacillus sp. B03 TaxID=3457430 RepID=UPI003FCC69DC